MAKQRFFSAVFYNGDWHTKLLFVLKSAKAETSSPEVRMAIESLEMLLATSDECIHTVSVIREIPEGLDGKQVMHHVQSTIGNECASVALKFPNAIELTLTARGGRRQVLSAANTLLSEGISAAQAEVWVRLRLGRTSDGKC